MNGIMMKLDIGKQLGDFGWCSDYNKNESNNILNPPNKSAENATNATIKNKVDEGKKNTDI